MQDVTTKRNIREGIPQTFERNKARGDVQNIKHSFNNMDVIMEQYLGPDTLQYIRSDPYMNIILGATSALFLYALIKFYYAMCRGNKINKTI